MQWKHKKRMLVMSNPVINPNGVLKGKIALVTGASRGIGEAIAVRLAMEGARVVCTARTAEEGESRLPGTLTDTIRRIRAAGGEATFIKADLSRAEDRERLVEDAVAAFGGGWVREAWGSYSPAFIAAGVAGVIAAGVLALVRGPGRRGPVAVA